MMARQIIPKSGTLALPSPRPSATPRSKIEFACNRCPALRRACSRPGRSRERCIQEFKEGLWQEGASDNLPFLDPLSVRRVRNTPGDISNEEQGSDRRRSTVRPS